MTSIMSFYIPYSRLHEIIENNFKDSNKSFNKCNLIIDLSSAINTLYYNKFNAKNENLAVDILEDILNMISHYKFGFRKFKVDLKFIFIFSENNPISSLNFYPYYNKNMKIIKDGLPTISKHVDTSLGYFKKLWKFLYNVIYIESNFDSSHIANKIIRESDDDILNIILSKDPTMFQNVSNDNIILRPYKDTTKNKDKSCIKDYSYIINNKNKFEYLVKNYQTTNNFDIKFDLYDKSIMSIIYTMSGIKQRSYNRVFKLSDTINILNEYVDTYNCNKIIASELFESFISDTLSKELLSKWKAIDSDYQYNLINDIFIYDVKPLIDREFLDNLNKNIFNNKIKFDEISN